MNPIDKKSSIRLDLLRFPLIIGVVFIHAYDSTVDFVGGKIGVNQNNFIVDFLRNLISQEIARTAVPLFFLMSGYLFFVSFTWSRANYINKLKSRVKTLLIPFLFWNIFTLILFALAQSLPVTQSYFSGKNVTVSNFGILDYLSAIFGIGRQPIAYQFWFIRDLMILILLAPAISWLSRSWAMVPFFLILFVCWVLDISPISSPSSASPLFFSIGCLLASTKRSLFALDNYGKVVTIVYIVIATLDSIFVKSDLHILLHKSGIILGAISVLFITKIVAGSQKIKQVILSLASTSFFVYAGHEPLLHIVRKFTYKIIQPNSPYLILALYFILPLFVIIVLIMAYRICSRLFPQFTRTITGGR